MSNIAYQGIHKRFVANLEEIGGLQNGVGVKIPKEKAATIPKEKVCALSAAADYFVEQKRVQSISTILPMNSQDILKAEPREIMEGFGLSYADTYTCRRENIWDMAKGGDFSLDMQKQQTDLLSVKGFDSVWELNISSEEKSITVSKKTKLFFKLEKEEGMLTISSENGLVKQIDVRQPVQKMYDTGTFETISSYGNNINWNAKDNLSVDVAMEGVNIRLLFFNVSGKIKAGKVQSIKNFNSMVLFAIAEESTP